MFRNPSRFLFNAFFAAGFAVLLPLLLPASLPGDAAKVEREWSDTSRDVYVDGELDPSVVTLVGKIEDAASQLAVWSEALGSAYVMDSETLDVRRQALSSFSFNGTGAVTRTAEASEVISRAIRIGSGRSAVHLMPVGEQLLVVASHQGPTGPTPLDDLFHVAPAWHRRAQAYAPDTDAVAALGATDRQIEVTVALGTWCGDSRNYVPKLIKALEEANNPNIRLDLMSIHRSFTQPAEFIRGEQVTNVPTVIVREAGEEIGRIVETPASVSVEADLAAILRGSLAPHRGRWQRGEEIAHGRYAYRDADERQLGTESWELFDTEDGGRLLHSVLETGDREIEIWHRMSSSGASEFAELTRRQGEELSRTRLWLDDDKLRSLTRGNATGIVEQKLEVPAGTRFLLPGAAAAGQGGVHLAATADDTKVSSFHLPIDQPAAGKLIELHSIPGGRETVATRFGEVTSRVVAARHGDFEARWWLDEAIGVPVRGVVADLGRVVLEELEAADGLVIASR
ncbi:MAG: thioredoxin family protein [Acidobacteriota bacterium]